ncbi:MAG: hypothetical protein ACHP7O_01325, partial [Burkholderiales bacterium]
RLLIFKEPFRFAPTACGANKSFCLSAAEKRDYAAFSHSRQLLCPLIFRKHRNRLQHLTPHHLFPSAQLRSLQLPGRLVSLREPNYSKHQYPLASIFRKNILTIRFISFSHFQTSA